MVQVKSRALKKAISVERIIGKINGKLRGPTIVFFSGIHGNETAGVFALQEAMNEINKKDVNGSIYCISGNLKALELHQRYVDKDLNRVWIEPNLSDLENSDPKIFEDKEQLELLILLKEIFNDNKGPFYFIDLHTTSGKTTPFITINDNLINRRFSKEFPVPIVLGIEEFLNGPLLSYINTLGYVSVGFESGQHDEINAVMNCTAFIYLALGFTNVVSRQNIPNFSTYFERLKKESKKTAGFYEIIDVHLITNKENFKMLNGFVNFQPVNKGTSLATCNSNIIKSRHNAKIFMPLYQSQGEEGFFIIKRVNIFFLKLSSLLRTIKADSLLILLPGISWADSNKRALYVNLKTARFLAKSIFHLLGYRNKQINTTHLKIFNRERAARTKMYKNEKWYRNRV